MYQYAPIAVFDPLEVADDYGPRINGDKWHGGVDYNSNTHANDNDRGDLIIALESGKIRGEMNTGYKRLFVNGTHNFGYGHMFWGQQSQTQSGGCFLRSMLDPNSNRWATIIIADGDTSAIGLVPGSVIFGNDTLVVRDSILAGQPIGPIGGSIGSDNNPGNLGPHLHLYSNPYGIISTNDEITKNPL